MSLLSIVMLVPFSALGMAAAQAVNDPPAAPHLFTLFPSRDLVTLDGYAPSEAITVQVIRNGVIVGTASGTSDAAGQLLVNHPGGVCWDLPFTPDIRPGDIVRATTAAGSADQTVVRNVTAGAPVQTGPGTVVIHGTAQDALGNPLPLADIDQRLINRDLFDFNGRRTLRAPGDGVIAFDPVGPDNPRGIKWTATYTGLSARDVGLALAAESRILWLGPLAAASTEITIFEFAAPGGPFLPSCPPPEVTVRANPPGGAFNTPQLVTLVADDPAATIFFTTDGTDPTIASAAFAAPISLATDGTTTLKFMAVGASGVPGQVFTQVYTIDTIAPVVTFTPPAGTYTAAQAVTITSNEPAATIFFTLDGTEPTPLSPRFTAAPILLSRTTVLRALAIDAAGNRSAILNGLYTIGTPDTTPPVLSLPANITVTATGPAGAVVTYTATANDAVSGPVTPTCSPASGSTVPVGTTTVTCTATDAAGNTATGSFTVTVNPPPDTTAPVLSLPANITVTATGPAGAVVTYTATANDAVSGPVTPTCSSASGSTFPLGTTTVTCTAADAAGNTATGSFTVTVNPAPPPADTTPPVLSLPANITVTATSAAGAVVTYTATANDAVSGPVTPTCSPASGSTFPVGTTTVTCTATDAAGNTATGSFTVTVNPAPPPAPVVLLGTQAVQGNVDSDATGQAEAFQYTAALSGTVNRLSVFLDATSTASRVVVGLYADTGANNPGALLTQATITAPVRGAFNEVAVPSAAVTAGQRYWIAVLAPSGATGTVRFRDVAAGGGRTQTSFQSTLGALPASWATGSRFANSPMSAFAIQTAAAPPAADTTPPVLSLPANITVTATSPAGAVVTYTATANDAVSGPVTPACSPASGSTFPVGTTTVTCTATDAAGNTATGSFTVTVNAAAPPAAAVVLFGSQTVQGNVDSDDTGMAEAFQYTSAQSGTVTKLSVFLDASSTASRVVVGLYADDGADEPGALLTEGSIAAPAAGTFNEVAVPAAAVTAGQRYWIAVLAPAGASGTIAFRDVAAGGGLAKTSAQTTLTTLPAAWATGSTFDNSPMSAFVQGTQP